MHNFRQWLMNLGYTKTEIDNLDKDTQKILLDEYTGLELFHLEQVIQSREMAKTIYLSGPMSSLTEEEYRSRFTSAETFFTNLGYTVINPVKLSDDYFKTNPEAGYDELMDNDLKYLKKCNQIALLEGWEDSKGCNIELQHSRTKGVFYL